MINFVFFSPNFPLRNFKYCEALKERGIRVLGIGDTPYFELNPRLRNALTEYYYLPKLDDFAGCCQAMEHFIAEFGPIDYLDSNNEWWLLQDAKLRERFGIHSGFYPEEMGPIKAKSQMKARFQKAGCKTMRYLLVKGPEDLSAALSFAKEVSYPVFVKPDVGVGASHSYRLQNEEEVESFLRLPLPETYIMEECVEGEIVSFDGLCDSNSQVAFSTSEHFPVSIADMVHDLGDDYFYAAPFELPMDDVDPKEFEAMGKRAIASFGIKQRFFHLEFFVLSKDRPGLAKKGEAVALECNMRAPGGYSADLIDFSSSLSVYQIYADLIAYDENRQDMGKEKYYAFAVERRDIHHYVHPDEELFAHYPIIASGRYPAALSDDMGDRYFFARFKSLEEGRKFAQEGLLQVTKR